MLTTGANSGIGLAVAVELARRGFHSIGSVRSSAKADNVARAAASAGVQVETVILDVADAGQCQAVMEGQSLWGLVNNAGYAVTGAIEDVGDEEARAILETMVVAPMRLARLALAGMRAGGGGRIVNVSSIAGLTTAPFIGWYTAAKHALEAATDALRVEVAGQGVKVVLVEPGGFRTGIWDAAAADVDRRQGSRHAGPYQRSLQAVRALEPLMGRPERVATVIAEAVAGAHPRARYLVGADAMAMAMSERMTPTVIKDRATRLFLGL